MSVHSMSISNPPECPVADFLISGKKPLEGRVYDDKRRNIKVGDVVKFTIRKTDIVFEKEVKYLNLYPSLEEYLSGEGVKRCLPGIENFEEACYLYNTGGLSKIPWADPKKREQAFKETGYAMVAIGFE